MYKRDPVIRKRTFYHLSKLNVTIKLQQPTRSGLCKHNLVSNFYPANGGTGVYLAFQPIRFTQLLSHLSNP